MTAQLRRYHIQAGRVDQFATERREDCDEFVWLLEHKDRESFEAADAAYCTSSERQNLQPNPARLIDEARKDWVITIF